MYLSLSSLYPPTADELRQKIATEKSEMERLSQEIQELQYLRQDSDLEDLSSASSSSSDSEDEEDLQDLLSQLIQDNEALEVCVCLSSCWLGFIIIGRTTDLIFI